MVKIGARIPDVRPGEQTIAYLTELQDGSRFFGGALLGCVAVACAMMDSYMVWAQGAFLMLFVCSFHSRRGPV